MVVFSIEAVVTLDKKGAGLFVTKAMLLGFMNDGIPSDSGVVYR